MEREENSQTRQFEGADFNLDDAVYRMEDDGAPLISISDHRRNTTRRFYQTLVAENGRLGEGQDSPHLVNLGDVDNS